MRLAEKLDWKWLILWDSWQSVHWFDLVEDRAYVNTVINLIIQNAGYFLSTSKRRTALRGVN
jgi:hypothetical protein